MEIDNVIKKAELIKEVDSPKGIDNLIRSLKSYKEKIGDIRPLRHYRFLHGFLRIGSLCSLIDVNLHGLTEHIVQCLERANYERNEYEEASIAGFVVDVDKNDEDIYNYAFDIENYDVSHKLEVLLYRNGFNTRKSYNLKCMDFFKD